MGLRRGRTKENELLLEYPSVDNTNYLYQKKENELLKANSATDSRYSLT